MQKHLTKIISFLLLITTVILVSCTKENPLDIGDDNGGNGGGTKVLDISTYEYIVVKSTIDNSTYQISGFKMDGTLSPTVFTTNGSLGSARWALDKSQIAFHCNVSTTGKAEIFIMNSDGSGVEQLTANNDTYGSAHPIFHPDGSKIWFNRGPVAGDSEEYSINYDGSGQTLLSAFDSGGKQGTVYQFFSNGTKILYYKQNPSWSPTGELYIANPNFTGEIQLTANSTGDNGASISPDGTKIVFCRCDNAAGYGSPYNIYKMDIDGGNVVKLTTATGSQSCSSPYWSSDGTKILYSYNDGSQSDIYIMNSDGTSSVNQTSTTTHNERITDYIY